MKAQKFRAWGHAQRAWVTVSLSAWQTGHREARIRWRRERHCRVGNAFIQAHHRWILTLLGICSCHIFFHTLRFASLLELPTISSFVFNLKARWYADRTDNWPLELYFQTKESWVATLGRLIAQITSTLFLVKISFNTGRFQWPRSVSISSSTRAISLDPWRFCSCCGPQSSFQMSIDCPSPTFHCTPCCMIYLVAIINLLASRFQ